MTNMDPTAHDASVDDDERPFLEHLLELRRRILYAVLAVVLLFFPLYYVANELYTFIAAPLMAHLPMGGQMIATEVASPHCMAKPSGDGSAASKQLIVGMPAAFA